MPGTLVGTPALPGLSCARTGHGEGAAGHHGGGHVSPAPDRWISPEFSRTVIPNLGGGTLVVCQVCDFQGGVGMHLHKLHIWNIFKEPREKYIFEKNVKIFTLLKTTVTFGKLWSSRYTVFYRPNDVTSCLMTLLPILGVVPPTGCCT